MEILLIVIVFSVVLTIISVALKTLWLQMIVFILGVINLVLARNQNISWWDAVDYLVWGIGLIIVSVVSFIFTFILYAIENSKKNQE